MPRARRYSAKEIVKQPYFRCGQGAMLQWSICAMGNVWLPCCANCDVELNQLVLEWAGVEHATEIIQKYAESMSPNQPGVESDDD